MIAIRKTDAAQVAQSGTGIEMIDAVACWCECLQGQAPLREGLALIASSIGSDAIALSRVGRHPGAVGKSIIHDRHLGPDRLERSFAACVLGEYVGAPKPGSVWFSTMMDTDADPALGSFQRRRHLSELAVIPLAIEDKTVDFLELHFTDRLEFGRIAMLHSIPATLARTWARRTKGLFSEVILKERPSADAQTSVMGILSIANPARLSRAEYRVCVLLARGLVPSAILSELAISNSTLRTHLRNIYAKTHTTNLAELTYALLATSPSLRQIATRSQVA